MLPSAQTTFERLWERLAHETPPTFVYAEINDLLSALTKDEFVTAVADRPDVELDRRARHVPVPLGERVGERPGRRCRH